MFKRKLLYITLIGFLGSYDKADATMYCGCDLSSIPNGTCYGEVNSESQCYSLCGSKTNAWVFHTCLGYEFKGCSCDGSDSKKGIKGR